MASVPTSTLVYVNDVATGSQTLTAVNIDAVGYYYFNGSVWVKLHNPSNTTFSSVNIYNTDGSLTGNRIVTQDANTLAFTSNAVNGFSVDGSTFSVNSLNNRIGLGTAAPTGKVDIVSDNVGAGAENDFYFTGYGNSANPAFFFGSARGTLAAPANLASGDIIGSFFFSPRYNNSIGYTSGGVTATYRGDGTTNLTDLTLRSSGSDRFMLNELGNVGITTMAPAATLDVAAKNPTGTSTGVDGLLIPRVSRQRAQSMASVPASTLVYINDAVSGSASGTAANIDAVGYYFFDGSLWTKLKTGATPDVNIYSNDGTLAGNRIVTQGTNTLAFTSNAVNGFSVDGSTLSVDALNNRVGVGTAAPHAQLHLGSSVANRKIVMYETADNDHEFYGFGVNSGVMRYQADRTTTDHVFYAGVTGGASSNELLRIKGTGNVGIGTSNPGVRLDVAQPIGTSEATHIRIVNTSAVAANNTAYLGFNSYNGGGASWGIGSIQNSTTVTDNNFHILYSSGGAYGKVFTIRPNTGFVGIGTTAPTSLLSVNGGADKPGGGTWGTFSDSRMKKNVLPYTKGLSEILKINTVTFQYNGKGGYPDDGNTYTGVIAQEIEKVLPETVKKIKSEDFDDQRKYDPSEITYTLINAVKEQQKLIEEQKKLIEEQSRQMRELQADVKALKAKK